MKIYSVFLTVLALFTSCNIMHKRKVHYLSTLENIKVLISHDDSLKIDSARKEFSKTYHCLEVEDYGKFRGGVSAFRQIIYDNFKVSKQAKEGENRIRITVGKQNNLEKVEILKYTDEDSKKAIEDIFKSKELSKWNSARLYRVPVEQQFEISIFIKNKNLRKS